jgi:site-specific recombinase XerD
MMNITGFMKNINHLSENTKRAYEQSLWQLNSNIKGKEPTVEEIEKFVSQYRSNTLHRHEAAIKIYWDLTHPEKTWPFKKGFFRTVKRKIPKHVSREIIKEMVKQTGSKDDRVFIMTLFNTGCRMPELMNLRAEDVIASGIQVKIRGGKYRRVPMTKEFLKVFLPYIKNKKGKIFPNSYNYYYLLIRKLGVQAHHPDMTPQVLRHSRVVDLLRNGMPLPLLQQFIGQADINAIALYLEIAPEITINQLSIALEKADS